jgi:hypothetical protein
MPALTTTKDRQLEISQPQQAGANKNRLQILKPLDNAEQTSV